MVNAVRTNIDQFNDLSAHDNYRRALAEGYSEDVALTCVNRRSRDNARTPYPWDDSQNGGFNAGHEPWLPLAKQAAGVNWQAEHDDPNSVWTFYQTLCRLRNASPLRADLIEGDFAPLDAHNDNVIAYARGQHVQIFVNLSSKSAAVDLPAGHVWLNNYPDVGTSLQPYQAILIEVEMIMAKNYEEEAKAILKLVGENNVDSVTHCQTRLRFVVKDRKAIDDKALEKLPEVKGVFYGSGQYQVIIGTGVVNDVYAAIAKLGTVNAIYGKDDADTAGKTSNEHKTVVQRLMAMLSGIFIPIIPVIAATGLFLGLKSAATNAQVLKLFGAVPSDIPASLTSVISVLTDTVFAFLPALIVWSTFRYFKGTPIIGIVIGLMLVSPILPNAYSVADGSAKAIMLFGWLPVVGSQGSVLTALVAGFIGAKLELFFRRHMPNVLEQILTPFLTMLVTFAIMIMGVGPIVHAIESGMLVGVEAVIHLPFGIGGFLIGAAYPLMVLIGIHQTMIAIETFRCSRQPA